MDNEPHKVYEVKFKGVPYVLRLTKEIQEEQKVGVKVDYVWIVFGFVIFIFIVVIISFATTSFVEIVAVQDLLEEEENENNNRINN